MGICAFEKILHRFPL